MSLLPTTKYKVRISCSTYNHANYIEDAMNGFCMQKTNFPFVAIIVDDASTDGEPEIIHNYLDNNFDMVNARHDENDDAIITAAIHKDNPNCHFLVIFLKYNFYSIRKARAYLYKGWYEDVPYIAICEGDDYWTDPLKLQKQVDYLEGHPKCTLVCNRTMLYSEKKKSFVGESYCYDKNTLIKTKDIIYRSGLFISTCSIVFRKDLFKDYPDYCRKCAVGDYPLQIMAAMKGKVYYFNDIMSVYRIENANSWMAKQDWGTVSNKNLRRIDSMIRMFDGFSIDFSKYKRLFQNKIAAYLVCQSPNVSLNNGKDIIFYKVFFKDYYKNFPLSWRIIDKFINFSTPKLLLVRRIILFIIYHFVLNSFFEKNKIY